MNQTAKKRQVAQKMETLMVKKSNCLILVCSFKGIFLKDDLYKIPSHSFKLTHKFEEKIENRGKIQGIQGNGFLGNFLKFSEEFF